MTVRVILDTDIDTDCDDVGALAVLLTLERQAKAEILGVICDIPNPDTARAVKAINGYYGRAEIPVGMLSIDSLLESSRFARYNDHLESAAAGGWRRYNSEIGKAAPAGFYPEDGVQLYRKILAGQPDDSTTIIAVGLLGALRGLLESGPDTTSPLEGKDLIRRKVKRLVTMGVGSFPAGMDVFNWKMDLDSAAAVLNHWPGELVVSEWGENILTGAALAERLAPENPVRKAYEIYLGGPGRSRSSWDQVAILYGVCGKQSYFDEIRGHRILLNPHTGEHLWTPDPTSTQACLQQVAEDEVLARAIEDLMVQAPG